MYTSCIYNKVYFRFVHENYENAKFVLCYRATLCLSLMINKRINRGLLCLRIVIEVRTVFTNNKLVNYIRHLSDEKVLIEHLITHEFCIQKEDLLSLLSSQFTGFEKK